MVLTLRFKLTLIIYYYYYTTTGQGTQSERPFCITLPSKPCILLGLPVFVHNDVIKHSIDNSDDVM